MTILQPATGAAKTWAELRRFLQTESAGGALLIGSGILALIWANSPAGHLYQQALDSHHLTFR